MFFQCTFKNVKDQISVKNYALFKLHSKIQKLTNNPIGVHLVIKQDKSNIFLDCKLNMGDKTSPIIIKNITGINFFEAIDNLSSKLERSILKRKTQKQNFRKPSRKRSFTNDRPYHRVVNEDSYEFDSYYNDYPYILEEENLLDDNHYSNWLS